MKIAPILADADNAVLAMLGRLPADVDADAALVATSLRWPEPAVARLLDELEAAGCVASASGSTQ